MQIADAPPTVEDNPALPLLTMAERLARTVAVARALILAGRTVDLAGIQDGIGLLCAKTLDLPPQQARRMLPALLEMCGQIDSLTSALRRPTTH
jgi:hypothetical protein